VIPSRLWSAAGDVFHASPAVERGSVQSFEPELRSWNPAEEASLCSADHSCLRVHGTFLSRVPETGDWKVARTRRLENLALRSVVIAQLRIRVEFEICILLICCSPQLRACMPRPTRSERENNPAPQLINARPSLATGAERSRRSRQLPPRPLPRSGRRVDQ
jgi:hypothetical protein